METEILPNKRKQLKKSLDESVIHVKVISDIVKELVLLYNQKKPIDLHALSIRVARHHSAPRTPKSVEIISALPAEYASVLSDIIKVKPIRTASGMFLLDELLHKL